VVVVWGRAVADVACWYCLNVAALTVGSGGPGRPVVGCPTGETGPKVSKYSLDRPFLTVHVKSLLGHACTVSFALKGCNNFAFLFSFSKSGISII
jgi:hypothetical protein